MFEALQSYFRTKDEDNIEHFSQWRLKRKKSKGSGWGIVIAVLLILIIALFIYIGSRADMRASAATPTASPIAPIQRVNAAAVPLPPRGGGWRGKKWSKNI